MESFVDSDDEVCWGPITLDEVKWHLSLPPKKITHRHTDFGTFPEVPNSKLTEQQSSYETAENDSLMKIIDILEISDEEVIEISDTSSCSEYNLEPETEPENDVPEQKKMLQPSTRKSATMVTAKKFVVAKIFDGEIQDGDVILEEEELPPIQDDEFLVEALYVSVDPYQRAYAANYKIGQVVIGYQTGKIIESKHSFYPVGTIVVGTLGWRTHTIIKPEHTQSDDFQLYTLLDIGDLSSSLGVGILGMPGNTAYFGFLEICEPKKGEVVVVTGAAGAVGNHVGQIAKNLGCTVIGITGSDEKGAWIKSIGFDHAINYKTTPDLAEELKKVAPNGIDCYFDNVGGETSSIIIQQLNPGGRISVCGSISSYNDRQLPKATILQPALVFKHLTMKGFHVYQFKDRWQEGIRQNLQWIQEGKLKYRETITEGFENTPKALIGVLKGENFGKAVVRVKQSSVETNPIGFRSAFDTFKKLDINK